MAQQLAINDVVLVPWTRVGRDDGGPSALAKATVAQVIGRRVILNLPDGTQSRPVGSSLVHREAAVLIVRIGDFQTELGLLDPLAKSLLQYLRLLLPDDSVRLIELRSLAEVDAAWPEHAPAFSHVVLVGHGAPSHLTFGVGGEITAEELGTHLVVQPLREWSFLSLCCQTGYAGFAKAFSNISVCRELIAPFHSVHGAIASQFAQTFFAYHFVQGETSAVAFRHARTRIPGAVSFRRWRQGTMTSDAA